MTADGTPAALPPAAAAPAPSVRSLSCPSCGGTVTLRAAGYSVTVVCQYCASLLDVAHPDVRLIKAYQEAVGELEIPLGTRGVLRGIEWEAIGYLRRSEGGLYPWEEYLLFNPYHGYRWLIGNGRGWSFGEMLTRSPGHNGQLTLDGELYAPFFVDGEAQVDYVLGEFYWRVQVGEKVVTDDYVRPGWMLSREANEQEVSWTLSEWLEPKVAKRAFGVDAPSRPSPPLPHQPSPYAAPLKLCSRLFLAAVALLLLITLFFSGGETLLRRDLVLTFDEQTRSATVGPIALPRPYQIVRVRARAPKLEQGWVDLDYALVDRANQASFEAYGVAERYSGRDSDGDWTEGSRSDTTKLAAVPAGTYDLVIDYSGHKWGGGQFGMPERQTLQLEVGRAAVFPSNVFLALLALLVPLLVMGWKHLMFEHARQSESDVGPTGAAAWVSSDEED